MSDKTNAIADKLLALKSETGVINPAAAVAWARESRKSMLHANLKWDDSVAGKRWRVSQVQQLIAVHIVDAEGGRRFVSLSINRRHDGSNGYRELGDVVGQPALRKIMLKDALANLERVQARYSKLSELQPIWERADKVREARAPRRKVAA